MGGTSNSARISHTIASMAGMHSNLTPEGAIGQILLAKSKEFVINPHTTQQGEHLLEIPGHGHFDQDGIFVSVWTHTSGRNGVAKNIL